MNEDKTAEEVKEVSNTQLVMNLESLIKNLMQTLDKEQAEVGTFQDTLNDIFENDETFKEHSKLAKEASKVKSATKRQILKQPQAADLDNKIRTLKSEIKENKASLSDYLREYQRMSGINEIEGTDGELLEIVYDAKLIRKRS